jgi:hypothetical protein
LNVVKNINISNIVYIDLAINRLYHSPYVSVGPFVCDIQNNLFKQIDLYFNDLVLSRNVFNTNLCKVLDAI